MWYNPHEEHSLRRAYRTIEQLVSYWYATLSFSLRSWHVELHVSNNETNMNLSKGKKLSYRSFPGNLDDPVTFNSATGGQIPNLIRADRYDTLWSNDKFAALSQQIETRILQTEMFSWESAANLLLGVCGYASIQDCRNGAKAKKPGPLQFGLAMSWRQTHETANISHLSPTTANHMTEALQIIEWYYRIRSFERKPNITQLVACVDATPYVGASKFINFSATVRDEANNPLVLRVSRRLFYPMRRRRIIAMVPRRGVVRGCFKKR